MRLRHADYFRLAPDAILLADARGRVIDANLKGEALFGYSLDELCSLGVSDLIDHAEHTARPFQPDAFAPGVSVISGRSLRCRDGRTVACELHIVVLASGEVMAVVRELDRRAQTATHLAAVEEIHRDARWTNLLESAFDAIVTVDEQHRVVLFNRAAEQMFGVSASEVLGGTLDRFVPPESLARHHAGIKRFTEHPEPTRMLPRTVPLRGVRADGSVFPIEVALSFSLTPAGERLFTAAMRDTSERERADAERRRLESGLQHTQKLESLGVLAGGIAHDFNNILMSILGHAELSLATLETGSRVAGDLHEIRRACQRAAELCQQLLVYAGRSGPGRPEPVELQALFGDIAELLRVSRAPGARLVLDLAGSSELAATRVLADPMLLRQVVINVITNASEALEGGAGTIHVAASLVRSREQAGALALDALEGGGPWLELAVSDNGSGIDGATLPRIFDPFFTTRFAGRGLGLSAVLGIVRDAKGGIAVTSARGVGTTFRILLPVVPADATTHAAGGPDAASGWSGWGGMLVVDDEAVVLRVTRRMLESLGFTVFEALGAAEALAVAAAQRGVLRGALVDLTMPEVDGVETIALLQAAAPGIASILTSGYPSEHVSARAGDVRYFIKKPYTLIQLRELMRVVLP